MGGGLLTPHNSTPSHARFWAGGSKVVCTREVGEYKQVGGGRRGVITGFSRGSRRRLMLRLAEISRDDLPLFVTLTFPDDYFDQHDNPRDWKKKLKRFEMRFRRRFPSAGYVWRLELQDRKSGKHIGTLFPHFHLLTWGVCRADLLSWLPGAWWEACGKLSKAHLVAGTGIDIIPSVKALTSYVSKYVAKTEEFQGKSMGRVWGVVNPSAIPWVRAVLVQLTDKEAAVLLRYLRRYARLRGRHYDKLSIILDADYWYDRLDRLLYP